MLIRFQPYVSSRITFNFCLLSDRPSTWIDAAADYWRRFRRDLGVGGFSLTVAIATHTAFPLPRWIQQRRIDRGETIWLDDMPGPSPSQTFERLPFVPANLTPNPGTVRRKARHMKVDYPSTTYPSCETG